MFPIEGAWLTGVIGWLGRLLMSLSLISRWVGVEATRKLMETQGAGGKSGDLPTFVIRESHLAAWGLGHGRLGDGRGANRSHSTNPLVPAGSWEQNSRVAMKGRPPPRQSPPLQSSGSAELPLGSFRRLTLRAGRSASERRSHGGNASPRRCGAARKLTKSGVKSPLLNPKRERGKLDPFLSSTLTREKSQLLLADASGSDDCAGTSQQAQPQ